MADKKEKDAIEAYEAAIAKNREGLDRLLSTEATVLLLDVSGSMSDPFGEEHNYVAKIEAMKKAMASMLQERIDYQRGNPENLDEIAIIKFPSGDGWFENPTNKPLVDLGRASEKHVEALDNLRPGGGTPMYTAFRVARTLVERGVEGLVRIIVVSDGEPQDKSSVLEIAAWMAENLAVCIDTIGVGDVGSRRGYDEDFLKELAKIGEGTFTHIGNAADFATKLLEAEQERRALLGNGLLLLGKGE